MSHSSKDIVKNLSINCVVFGSEDSKLKVLLIKRKNFPNKGDWALPGGFVLKNEDLDKAAVRILAETSNVKDIYLEQVHTFGDVDRFPSRRVISITYFALINPERFCLSPGIDTTDVKWFPVHEILNMPFDHDKIYKFALQRLKKSIRYKPIGFELLPKKFTLTQLQSLYESILDHKLDKRNFRKKLLAMNLLHKLDEKQKGVPHRAAKLFRFELKNYERLRKNGFNFEL
jgi:8-oxo-dGTP diphosphatase